MIVAFRSAKVRIFAERKTTMDCLRRTESCGDQLPQTHCGRGVAQRQFGDDGDAMLGRQLVQLLERSCASNERIGKINGLVALTSETCRDARVPRLLEQKNSAQMRTF